MKSLKYQTVLKHIIYSLCILVLYLMQTTPSLFKIFGNKPLFVIPYAVILAMYEGEFAGGIYGAVAGLLCDMSSRLLFGFNGFIISFLCIGTALLIIYYVHLSLKGAFLFVFLIMLIRGSLESLFAFGMWGYDNSWKLFFLNTLPVIFYSTALVPPYYFLIRKIYNRFYKGDFL